VSDDHGYDLGDDGLARMAREALSLRLPGDLAELILARSRAQPARPRTREWLWIPATTAASLAFLLVSLSFLIAPRRPDPIAASAVPASAVPIVVTFHAVTTTPTAAAQRVAYTVSAGGAPHARGELALSHFALDTVDARVLGREPF